MITNLLLEHQDMDYEETERKIKKEIEKLLMGVAKTKAVVIMVSNEIGSGIVPENPLTRAFRDIAGRMNQHIAEQCGEVFLTVCGLPLKLK